MDILPTAAERTLGGCPTMEPHRASWSRIALLSCEPGPKTADRRWRQICPAGRRILPSMYACRRTIATPRSRRLYQVVARISVLNRRPWVGLVFDELPLIAQPLGVELVVVGLTSQLSAAFLADALPNHLKASAPAE
jgi:hypothetical protein